VTKSRVALVRCETYDDREVESAVRAGLDLLGGMSEFVRPGESIVVKPNVLIGSNPTKCVTTHPSVLRAVGRLLIEAGASLSYGDSPSFGKCEGGARRSHLTHVGDELGMRLADFDRGRQTSHPDGLLIKSFVLANGVLEADGLVSLPKLKTHALTRFTGAVKNQFGCIPGFLKAQYHVKLPDPYDFSTMLVDLNSLIGPRLCVMDGIEAMEGNGPRGGKPKKLGVLIISDDPIAMDATACRIIDLDPGVVPTSAPGERSGLGRYRQEAIEVVGESIESFLDPTFEVIRRPPRHQTGGRLRSFVRNRTCERPAIDEEKCNSCGTCVEMCPVEPKAVDWRGGDRSRPPAHDHGRCIRCYCCLEVCPEGAISVRNPLLGRLLTRL
jgi:uncharacterized protein (DUF362 family)/NAD-dependent dihydropyrimidine dehydrogenase PreA subunit